MNKLKITVIIILTFNQALSAQDLPIKKVSLNDSIELSANMKRLAKDFLLKMHEYKDTVEAKDLFRIKILAEMYKSAIKTIHSLREEITDPIEHPRFIQYETYAKAKSKQSDSDSSFRESYASAFTDYLQTCSDEQACSVNLIFTTYMEAIKISEKYNYGREEEFKNNIKRLKDN